ncbi:hypothetical protein [Hymenobacter sp. GOD-10R]|uniref:hypothetical protein n=1 Tax=Hymenobacter sp. GOD-10R TaxID=3093922 RepID=UPI002D77D9AC|nr:hypothetical protein [Hymenobacter sp. GOD-10R]WRQ31156.1 hypothetical protein SD425_12890 [Hymenobacter sp. GOD-10R]
MRTCTCLHHLAGFGLLLFLGFSGCTAEDTVCPATTTECSELVTVRFCASYGDSPTCVANHTTLQVASSYPGLPAGYHVLPVGAEWRAYQARQVNGQVLRVGFKLGPALPPNVDGLRTATITCLETAEEQSLGK